MEEGLEKAGRNLLLVDAHLSQEIVERGDLCMTQVPVMFSDDESDLVVARDEIDVESATEDEAETQIPAEKTADHVENVLISTQVQSKMDEIDQQEDVVHSFRHVLSRFALETQEQIDIPAASAKKVAKKAKAAKVVMKTQRKIKSITEFNTEKWESDRIKDRAQKMISMLSGKSAKAKRLVSKLNHKEDEDTPSNPYQQTQFSTFNAAEWSLIVKLLQERIPKVTRTDIKNIQQYVYGETNLWQTSQVSPDQESETILPSIALPEEPPVFTLSQLVDDRDLYLNEKFRLNEDSLHERETLDADANVNIDVPSSETDIPSHVMDSCDSGSIISFNEETETKNLSDSSKLIANGLARFSSAALFSKSEYFRPLCNDQLIDLSQKSYDVVSSIVSPLRRDRMGSIQVPATRTTTFQDVSKPIQVKVYSDKPSNEDNNMPHERIQINRGDSLNEMICSNENRLTDSNSTMTTKFLHNKDEIIADSEDEKGEYSIMEIKDVPQLDLTQLPMLPPSSNKRMKTPVSAGISLDTEISSSSFPPSPNTTKLRQSMKTIGLKPCKNKVHMLQVWDTLESKISGDSDSDRSTQLKQFLTELIIQNRERSDDLMEQIYTFEPIRYDRLKSWLVSLDSFTELIDDSFIKRWADINGIVFRNDSDDFSQLLSQANSQSQSQSQLQSPSESPSESPTQF